MNFSKLKIRNVVFNAFFFYSNEIFIMRKIPTRKSEFYKWMYMHCANAHKCSSKLWHHTLKYVSMKSITSSELLLLLSVYLKERKTEKTAMILLECKLFTWKKRRNFSNERRNEMKESKLSGESIPMHPHTYTLHIHFFAHCKFDKRKVALKCNNKFTMACKFVQHAC